MEGRKRTEQNYDDEFDLLLGEIPNATSETLHVDHPINADTSSRLGTNSVEVKSNSSSPSSKFANLYSSPQSARSGGDMGFFHSPTFSESPIGQNHRSNGNESHALNGEQNEPNLPDDKSLTLAFEELSFKDRVIPKPTTPSVFEHNHNYPYNNFMNTSEISVPHSYQSMHDNVNFPDYLGIELKKRKPEILPSDLTSQRQNFPLCNGAMPLNPRVHPYPEILPSDLTDQRQNFPLCNGAMPLNPRVHPYPEILPSDLTDQRQNFPLCNGSMPLNPRVHPYQLLPNVPSPYQQQFFLDAQVPALIPPRHLGQTNMTWQNMEEERFYRLQQQYLCQQQLQNHRSEVVNFRKNLNSASNPVSGSQVQRHYEFLSNPNSFWNDNAVHSAYNQHHPQSSCGRVLDEDGNHYFPEKILTRSHGVNSLRSIRSNSVMNNSSSLFSRSHGHLVMNNGSFKLDSRNSRSSSPDGSDFLNASKSSIQVKYNSVDEIIGKIYTLAKDQHGCRFLQRKFTEGSPEDINKIFIEIVDHIVDLMTDPFGNYLVQKLLEVCNEDQRMQIVHAITGEASIFIKIACNMHGTRAVQKVIETLKTQEQIYMVASSLKHGIVPLIKDVNGNHVAQRCLQYFSAQQSEFLFDAAISHCVEIATDRQGCCVLQKCVYHSYGDQRNRLMSEISSYSLVLSQDPYGNYVVQYVLDQKLPWVITSVLNQLEDNYVYLSRQKHSSNVVEKCLNLAKEVERVKIIQELMASPQFLEIVQDPYGNYVIQSVLKLSKGSLNAAVVEAIKPHVAVLRSNPYGKKVLSSTSLKK